MPRRDFALIHQLLCGQGCRRHCRRSPEQDCRRYAPANHPDAKPDSRTDHAPLQASGNQNFPAITPELRQGKFEAHHEEEQQYTRFSYEFEHWTVPEQIGKRRSKGYADQDVTEDGRQFESVKDYTGDERRGEQYKAGEKEVFHEEYLSGHSMGENNLAMPLRSLTATGNRMSSSALTCLVSFNTASKPSSSFCARNSS